LVGGIIDLGGVDVSRPFFIVILVILLAGLGLFGLSDTAISIADTTSLIMR